MQEIIPDGWIRETSEKQNTTIVVNPSIRRQQKINRRNAPPIPAGSPHQEACPHLVSSLGKGGSLKVRQWSVLQYQCTHFQYECVKGH